MEALEDRFNPTVVTIAAITHAVEGSSSMDFGTNGAVRVSRDNSSGDLAVSYSVGGTATYGTDYTGANLGSITIPGGHSSIDLYYFPNFDSLVEGTETIVVSLGTPYGGYTVGSPSSATLNLYDNNTPRVTVAKQGSDPTEGGDGTFRISRTGSTAASLAVAFGTGGTATSGTDYTSIGTSATIGAGNTYVDVTVSTLADNVVDPSETVAMTITDGGTAYSAYGSSATATITIADDPVVVSIAATDTTEGSSGKFRISRAGGKTADSLTVNYSVTGGTAGSGTDFTALSGTVVIGAGNSYADVTLTALADTLIEGDETVEVTVSSGGSVYTISGGVATAIIADDAPTISIARLTDGFEGAGNGSFRVTRTGGDITQALTLTYTVGGTASSVSSADFTALSGTVTIAANASYADITVTITNDSTAEPTETVIATLGASTDYLITGGPATIFIWDNDQTAFHWTGASSDNWMVAGNWYENAVPGAGDAVYFDNAYSSNDALLSGPLSAYAIGELHVLANYVGTITLSFPLETGSLMMLGGTIDQPSSGYGSNGFAQRR